MIDIENKVVSYREDTDDYRLCLSREEIEEIKNCRANAIDECIETIKNCHTCEIIIKLEMLKEQNNE